MVEEKFNAGDVIFEAFSEDDSSLNFILNGQVLVELWSTDDDEDQIEHIDADG